MKIAITGHSAGIGQAFAKILQQRGHEIVGLSKRNGDNIRVIPKIADKIEHCDLFINNAQSGYAQTELLYEICQRWQNQPGKCIWCVSTMMTQSPIDVSIAGQTDYHLSQYRNQKIALEEACVQLRHKPDMPNIVLIRPGAVATQPGQENLWPYANVDAWANVVVDSFIQAEQHNLRIKDLSLSSTKYPIHL